MQVSKSGQQCCLHSALHFLGKPPRPHGAAQLAAHRGVELSCPMDARGDFMWLDSTLGARASAHPNKDVFGLHYYHLILLSL